MTRLLARIDRRLVWPKAYYFFYYSAAVSLIPFLSVYYKGLGLSGREIGLLTGIPPLISLFGAPFWSGLADATRQHRRLLLVATVCTLLAVWALSSARTFLLLVVFVTIYAFFVSPIMPLIDNSVIEMLGEHKNQYGRQRYWGAVGWGLAAPLVGWLVERNGMRWYFYGFLGLMLFALYTSTRMHVTRASIGARFWSGLRALVTSRTWLLFLVAVFLGGMSMAMISNFLFLYMDDLHAGEALMGLSLTVATLSEIPVMFFSEPLIRRWGAKGLLNLALLAYVVRLLAYSFIRLPWLVLPIQLLHGPTFSALWVGGVSYADEISPPGMGTTAQGILAGAMMGLGGTLGALAGGLLYDEVGGAAMFRWTGAGLLLVTLAFMLADRSSSPLSRQVAAGRGDGNERMG